jgi:hypothetical protein
MWSQGLCNVGECQYGIYHTTVTPCNTALCMVKSCKTTIYLHLGVSTSYVKTFYCFGFQELVPSTRYWRLGGGGQKSDTANTLLWCWLCSQVGENNGKYGHSCAAEDMCRASRKVTVCEELCTEDFKLQQQHPTQYVNHLVCCPFIFSYWHCYYKTQLVLQLASHVLSVVSSFTFWCLTSVIPII